MQKPVAPNAIAIDSLRTVIRWVQHEGGLPEPTGSSSSNGKIQSGATLEKIAERADTNLDRLNKFLKKKLNTNEEEKQFTLIASGLSSVLEDRKDIPVIIRTALQDVFGATAFAPRGIIKNSMVIGHRSLIPREEKIRDRIKPFEGLSVILRRANETVPDKARNEPGAITRGWSLSLLNIPPKHVQEGAYHPLFKLKQRAKTRNTMKIEGVVVVKADRLVLQGIETTNDKSFTASVFLNDERLTNYRTERLEEPPMTLSGVMLGLASTYQHFGALFEIFAVPGGTLEKGANQSEIARFDQYYSATKEAAGVRDLADTLDVLHGLGIKATEDQLIQLQTRAAEGDLLTAF
ncbi:MAG: hypothetical protein ACRBB0_20890 [Pelagimonas sp.]|uniref:hypothetical protein n=1 Tax=Pelagimonas sp. TaxID=2073170 RepID=UPI003D6A1E36